MSATMRNQLDRLRSLATVLDDAVRVPGTNIRFGLDAVLGLLPGAGDAVTGVMAAYAMVLAARLGADNVLQAAPQADYRPEYAGYAG